MFKLLPKTRMVIYDVFEINSEGEVWVKRSPYETGTTFAPPRTVSLDALMIREKGEFYLTSDGKRIVHIMQPDDESQH